MKTGTKVEKLPKGVERLPDGTYRGKRYDRTIYALDPELKIKHRVDGPAIVRPGLESWWLNGQLHRIGGPAYTIPRYKTWYVNGQRHRIDGPATVGHNIEIWYVNDQMHRIGGEPAYVALKRKKWYVNGQLHRIDGPAFVTPTRTEWWVEGVQLTEEDYNNLMKKLSTLTDDSDKEATIAAATMFD